MKRAVVLPFCVALLMSAGAAEARPAPHSLDQRALRKALLRVSDLPSGYARTKTSSADDTTDSCKGLSDPPPSQLASAEVDFSRGTLGPFFGESVLQLRKGTAAKALRSLDDALAKCSHFTAKTKDGVTSGRLERESFPTLGDDTTAVRMTVRTSGQGLNLAVTGDLVIVRTADILVLVAQFAFVTAPPIETFEPLVRRAVDRVRQAQGSS